MPTMDQVAWAGVNAVVGTQREHFTRGALLPAPATADEAYDRQTLRLIGAIRVVEVVYTPEELAEQMKAAGQQGAAREAAGQVDPAAPLGDQTELAAAAGPPTVTSPGGAPVVIGDEDLKAEHAKAEKAAAARAEAAAKPAAEPAAEKAADKAADKDAAKPSAPAAGAHQARRPPGGSR